VSNDSLQLRQVAAPYYYYYYYYYYQYYWCYTDATRVVSGRSGRRQQRVAGGSPWRL